MILKDSSSKISPLDILSGHVSGIIRERSAWKTPVNVTSCAILHEKIARNET